MKKLFFYLSFMVMVSSLSAQALSNLDFFSRIDQCISRFQTTEYYEIPYTFYAKDKTPKGSNYLLFVSNSQSYGDIYSRSQETGKYVVLMNAYDRDVFLQRPFSSHPGPVYIVMDQLPSAFDYYKQVNGIVVGKLVDNYDGRPVFYMIEGCFEYPMTEFCNGSPEDVDLSQFDEITILRYVDSMQ